MTLCYTVRSTLGCSVIHTSHLTKKTTKRVARNFNWTFSVNPCMSNIETEDEVCNPLKPCGYSMYHQVYIKKFPVLCMDLRTNRIFFLLQH
jgi:hypothetical protein